jgi:hypothetical protein
MLGGLDAVYYRHVQVEEDGVRSVSSAKVDGFLAISGGGDHVDVGKEVEQQYQTLSDARLIIGHDDP